MVKIQPVAFCPFLPKRYGYRAFKSFAIFCRKALNWAEFWGLSNPRDRVSAFMRRMEIRLTGIEYANLEIRTNGCLGV
jgi:hypothetical protein